MEEVDRLEQAASQHGAIFRRQEPDATLGSLVSNVWNGFVQGFTTLPVGEKPTNEIDGIAHSIGHLLGFIGIIPGLGTIGSAATKIGIKSTGLAGRALARSVPMRAADLATKKLSQTAVTKSVLKASDAMFGPKKELGRQMIRHGAHLGIASATSDIWENMKEEDVPGFLANTFWSGVQGGIFGATFAGIGNIKLPEAIAKANLGPVSGRQVLQGIAGSLAQTAPGAMQGASTPENVYNALLGAYFGGKSKPWAWEKQYRRQVQFRNPTSEQEFAWYKTTSEFKDLSKIERAAAEDVHLTFFNQREAGDVVSRLIGEHAQVEPSPSATERLATVRTSHSKYGDQQVVVIKEMPKMAKVRVDDNPEPVLIKKDYLRFEEDYGTVLGKKLTDAIEQGVESADPAPGDTPMDIPIVRPVENFFKKILKTEQISPERYSKNLNDLNQIIFERIEKINAKKEAGEFEGSAWAEVKKDILTRFKEHGVNETDLAEIRNYYRRSTESIDVPRFALHKNKLVPEVEFDHNNNRISTAEPIKLVHRVAMDHGLVERPADAYFVVKNEVGWKESDGKLVQRDIGNVKMGEVEYKKLVNLASKKGYYPYSGKSDSSVFIFMKKNLGDFKAEKIRIYNDMMSLDPAFKNEYVALRKQAIKEGGFTKAQYDEMFVSNVRWWEAINGGINIKDIATGEGFIKDVMNFNKRQQPLFSDYYSLTSDTFDRPFRYIVANDLKESSDPKVKNLMKRWKKQWEQEHDDGAVPVRMDKLDMIVQDMGLPEFSGFAKPFFTSNEGGLGTLIGKLAFHGASPAMTKAMKEAGIDFIVPTSVAKQYGNRQIIDYNFDGKSGKMGFSHKGKSIDPNKLGSVYEMSPQDIAVSWGVKDGSMKKLGSPERVYKQIQEQFMNFDVQDKMKGKDYRIDINKVMNDFIHTKFEGDQKLNISLAEYIKGRKLDDKKLKYLSKNFERLGAREIVDAMKDMTEAGESFREMVRRKVQRMHEEGMEEGSVQMGTDWEAEGLKSKLTSAQRLLESGGTKDAVALSKDIAPMMDRAITRYFLKRILQPQVQGAKAIMRHYSLDLAQRESPNGNTSRLIKEENIFFLDDNFRDFPMLILNDKGNLVKGTLFKQWEYYRNEKDGTVAKQQMAERMRSLVVRTPIDSVSGLADLEFAGFTGIKGGGVLLHPKIMRRLGGADLDIDSAMIYVNSLPKEFHRVGDAFKNDFHEIMEYADKKHGGYDKIIQRYIVKDKVQGRDSFAGMFDPFLRMYTASTIQNAGTVMRGIAVNAKTQMRMLYNVAKQQKGGKLFHTDKNGFKLEFVPKKSEMDLKLHGMAAVTVTVDVAKYGKLVKPEVLKRILFESGFEALYVTDPSGKRIKLSSKGIEKFFGFSDYFINYKDSPIGEFADTVNKFFGKDWRTGMSWERRDVITAAENHPKWDQSVYRTLSDAIKQLDYSDSYFERLQMNTRGFSDFMKKINRIIKDNPELRRYVGDDFKGVPFAQLVKRMNILSRYYTADRSNRLLFEQPFNLATAEGIKRMAANKDVFNKFVEEHVLGKKPGNFLKKSKAYNEKYLQSETQREIFLKRYIKEINDFISNDFRDLATLKTINDTGAIHGIKFDADLPRYKKDGGSDQLVSLNKHFMDWATAVKNEFRDIYRKAKEVEEASPNQTALDRVNEILNGDGPASVKSKIAMAVDYINRNKRESDPEVTEKGLREFFDSYLLGAINKDGKTQSLYFVPQLVSKPVLQRFNDNMHEIFTLRGTRPKISDIEAFFSKDPTAKLVDEAAKLQNTVEDIEFLKPKIAVKDLSTDMQGRYNRISKLLKVLSEHSGIKGDKLQKFISSWFAQVSGKADPRSYDKMDLAGFERFLDDVVNGSGLFRFFTRGKLSKYAGFWKEIDEKGVLKPALGHWVKMSESTAFDHLKNDFKLIERQTRAWKWVRVPDPDNPGKFKQVREYGKYKSWAPTSHFQMLIDSNYGIAEYTSGMRNIIEDSLQEKLGSRIINGSKSKENKIDKLVDVAWREIEADGKIHKVKNEYKVSTERVVDSENSAKFKKRLEDAIETYEKLQGEKYSYTINGKTKNYEAREVINAIKEKIGEVMLDTYNERIKLGNDFINILRGIIKKTSSDKIVKTSQGEIDVTEIPTTHLIKHFISPLTLPGAIVNKKGRHISLEEAHLINRETDIKNHSLDAWNNKKKKSNEVPEYDIDYKRTLKEVYQLKPIENLFKDDAGNRIPLFEFFNNKTGTRLIQGDAVKYLNNLYNMFKGDKLSAGWEAKWEADVKYYLNRYGVLSRNMAIRQEAYKAYQKHNLSKNQMSNEDTLQRIGGFMNYFQRKNVMNESMGPQRGYVPWKESTDMYSQYLHDIALAERKINMPLYIRQKRRHDPMTGFQPIGFRENYMPHLNFDEEVINREILEHADKINRTVNSKEEAEKAHDALIKRKEKLIEDATKEDGGIADHAKDSLLLTDLAGDRGLRHLTALGGGKRPGNMLRRTVNFDGYSRHISEIGNYIGTIQHAIGSELSAVLSKKTIRDFSVKSPMGKYNKDWEHYMRIFARDVASAPSTVSEEMLNSEVLNIKRTPWWYTSDQYLYSKKSVYKLVDKLSGRSKPSAFLKELYKKRQKGIETNGQMDLFNPKSREGFEQWWSKQQELFGVRYDAEGKPIKENMNFFSGKMRQYSQLEGKYQLATLLARMKVVVNNVFGGGTNSWVYNGAAPLRNARNIEMWQSIDPRFKTMKDVDHWVYELGVVEEMIRYELGYLGMKRDPNWGAFTKDAAKLAVEKAKTGGEDNIYNVRLRDLAKRHNIGAKAMDVASQFMGRSELFLRTNTFKASYLAIRDSMSPVEYDLNDPYLIQQAKKGVKASQFLYSAPFRSPFARTSAGKIFSRFKLWAWNSVKFRKDVYKEAKYAGYRPGSKEFDRLQRMITADLFMIGLAKLLPYTMFDYSLPAPYSYFQDTSDWLFGSDEQRERAFYGALPRAIAPLHEVMPSILRGPEAVFGNIWTGNWERFANYTLVSYFPFGLLTRDVIGAIQSPALVGEFITGVPLHRMGRLKEDILEGKKAPGYAPGFY